MPKSIRTRLIVSALLVAFIGGCIGLVGYYSNVSTVALYSAITMKKSPKLFYLSQISDNANRVQLEALSYVLVKKTFLKAEDKVYEEEKSEMFEAIGRLRKNLIFIDQNTDFDSIQHWTEIQLYSEDLIYYCEEIILACQANLSDDVIYVFKEKIEETEHQLLTLISSEIMKEHDALTGEISKAMTKANFFNSLIVAISILGFLAALSIGMAVSSSIIMGLTSLKEAALSIGKGNLHTKISISRNDEIGSLARSFQKMTNDLRLVLEEKTRLIFLKAEAEKEKIRLKDLEKANIELEQFAFLISHDLKAPLVNMSSLLNMIEHESQIRGKSAVTIDKVQKVIEQMKHKITVLNDVIRIKKNLELEKHNIMFSSVLDSVIENLASEIDQKRVSIESNFVQCPYVCFAPIYLQHIMMNLLTNAIQYRRLGVPAIVSIKSYEVEDTICLEIADNGRGIDLKAYGHKLFGLFQRFHLDVQGDGVGLYLVKNIVDAYETKIKVESSIGIGTTFYIFFPKV